MADEEPDKLQDTTSRPTIDFVELEPIVTTVHADLFLSFGDDDTTSWNVDEVFATAVRGIFDALLPSVILNDSHVHTDGDFTFARDLEAAAPSIDRRGSYLLRKKVKERASNAIDRVLKHPLHGNSRNPSRASSRAQSRVSAALTSSVMAMKMVKLAFGKSAAGSTNGDAAFRIKEWNEKSPVHSKADPPNGYSMDSYAEMSSRYSLGSPASNRTSRVPVDYKEVRRREEIARDIETREGREKMTARIQRKGNVKLKLRSMADPSVSVEREEREAAMKSRGAMLSRGISRVDIPALDGSGAQPLARVNSVVGGVNLHSLAAATSRSHETTYRPEDYEGLASELVILDKKGELLVGENCYLVARKPRDELQRDLSQQNTVKPRVHFPQEESNDVDAASVSTTPVEKQSPLKASPGRAVSRQSPKRQSVVSTLAQSYLFEGQTGQYQSYPKIELDPKKTPLTKGVTIKPPELPVPGLTVAAPVALKEVLHPPSTKLKTGNATLKTRVSEDHANDILESQMTEMMRSTEKAKLVGARASKQNTYPSVAPGTGVGDANNVQSSARSTSRTTASSRNTEPKSAALPQNQHHRDHDLLQGLRLRTPAYGNRTGRAGTNVLGISRGEFLDQIDDEQAVLHEAVNQSGTLQTPSKLSRSTANLPQFSSYVREFPTPPKGQIHIISSKAAVALLSSPTEANNGFPFSSLPSVIRGKR